ncbi:hypothetical protein Tco_0718470 [Tanacetum coccineum]
MQGVALFALAWMDFHELVLTGDLWSIGVQIGDVALTFVVGLIGFVVVKYSSNKGLNRNSNYCNDGAFLSAGGETFGTSVELELTPLTVP